MTGMLAIMLPSPAFGEKTVVASLGSVDPGFTGGLFNTPRGVAVNQSGAGGVAAGTLYVADSLNHRVQQFGPDGTFVRAWGWGVDDGTANFQTCKVAAECGAGLAGGGAGQLSSPQGVVVDPATGGVYVADHGNRRISIFRSNGEFIGAFGWNVRSASPAQALQFCSSLSGCQGGSGGSNGFNAGQFAIALGGNGIGGLAIAPAGSPNAGDLYVANKAGRRVDEFKPVIESGFITGIEYVRGFGWGVDTGAAAFQVCTTASVCQAPAAAGTNLGQFGLNSPSDVAVDATGNVFALDFNNKRVQKFDSTPTPLEAAFGGPALSAVFGLGNLDGIAIDRVANRIFVVGRRSALASRIAVVELDGAGALVETHGSELQPVSANGLAEEETGSDLDVSSSNAGHRVYVLSDATPTILDADGITADSATLHGEVVSNNVEVSYHFEYSADGGDWTKLPASDASIAPTPGSVAVEQATGNVLHGHTTYSVRLVVVRPPGGLALTSPIGKFTTLDAPPVVEDTEATGITSSTAWLKGRVNPENQATDYQFEYLTQAAFEANGDSFAGPNAALRAPASPAAIPSGIVDTPVAEQIMGLAPETEYRFRLFAENAAGTAEEDGGTFKTYSPPDVFPACPNDAFRVGADASLPDCRAFEQASPIDKNGANLQGRVATLHASADGTAVTFEAAAGLPGGEGAQAYPTYLASRGTGGWTSQGLLPNANAGDQASVLGWTEDFAFVFDSVGTVGGDGNAFVSRSSADGSLETVVDNTSPEPGYTFVGASRDGSKVFFQAQQSIALPPGQPTPAPGKWNVYAWDRDTGALSLAGVLPDGSVPAEGTEAGANAASKVEYVLEQRAVSSDGNAVYFTDSETGQVYMRLNPTDPATAQTVHISASQRTAGVDPGGPLPATFAAGAGDGSGAIFMSSEELTDDAHTIATKAIARANIVDGVDAERTFLPAVEASAIDVEADFIYWIDRTTDSIGRAAIDGGSPEPSFITGIGNPFGIAVDANFIYWSDPDADSIGRVEIEGDNPEPNFIVLPDVEPNPVGDPGGLVESDPQGIDVGGGFIYWIARGGSNPGAGGEYRAIGRAQLPVSPGDPPTGLNSSFINIQPTGGGFPGVDVAVNATAIFWNVAEGGSGIVGRADIDGSNPDHSCVPEAFAGNPRGLAADASHVYWTNFAADTIGRATIDCANANPSFVPAVADSIALALNSSHLYWDNNPSGRGADLYRYDEGQLIDLSSDEASPAGAEVQGVMGASSDGSYVYFAANGVPDGVLNSPNAQGESASLGSCEGSVVTASGACNLYLAHDDGANVTVTFIARLDTSGGVLGSHSDAVNWASSPSIFPAQVFQKTARVTPDGSTLLFRSQRQLTEYDNEGVPQFYRFQAGDASVTCVSCNPSGAAPSGFGAPMLGSFVPPGLSTGAPTPVLSRNISESGDRIFFDSTDALVGTDVNGDTGCPVVGTLKQQFPACLDVYEWEAQGTGSCTKAGGCLYLLSSGNSPEPSFFIDASTSGDDAFIFTTTRLVAQDGDELLDIYDARVGGGLAAQNPPLPVPCEGEACKTSPPPVPGMQAPGSASFAGPPDPAPKRTGKKSKRRKAKKCKGGQQRQGKNHKCKRRRVSAKGRAHR
jgi:hypothetical protein